MRLIVLGSAAGGGFPQWNCNCSNCRRCRAGDPCLTPRTQASIAVSASDGRWIVINASPDLRQQIGSSPQLHPGGDAIRQSPISCVVLTGSEIDQIAGLLTLRENQPLALYATTEVHAILSANPMFDALKRTHVARRPLALGETVDLQDHADAELGLRIELFSVPGKIPLYLEGDLDPAAMQGSAGDTVGVEIAASGKRLIFIPGCARLTVGLLERIDGADLLLFDGTLWEDDEMIRQGLREKTGLRMGHISVSGPDGTIAGLAGTQVTRRILIHINNSNPLLDDRSEARNIAQAAGWDVAFDGQELHL